MKKFCDLSAGSISDNFIAVWFLVIEVGFIPTILNKILIMLRKKLTSLDFFGAEVKFTFNNEAKH